MSYSFLTADREFSLVGETSGFSNLSEIALRFLSTPEMPLAFLSVPEIFDFCDFILVSRAIMPAPAARKGDKI